ncbi:MAG: HU family DNA-binding protein [Candidatus Marinimicrobia bacterium]|nr:HU family DNA-binding protein [Candidatus Neomarinimicrobiota bacterium]
MSIKITFQQLLDEFSATTGRTKAFSKDFIKDVFTTVQEGLRKDENVNIKGLGIFKLQEVAERKTVNPKTGKAALIEAHKKVVFKPEKALREKVNTKYAKLKTKKVKKKEAPKPAPTPAPVIIEKPKEKGQMVFGDQTPPTPPAPKKTPPPPAPKDDDKKIMPTFVIEEKKKRSAWRWLLPFILIILIFVVLYIVPTKFDSMEDLAFWKNWHWDKDSISDQPTIVETTVVDTKIKADVQVDVQKIVEIETIFVKAPLPETAHIEEKPQIADEPLLEKKEHEEKPEPPVELEDEQTLIHIIKPNNTLWGLSKHYYSRTSLWPNIYRKNVETLRTPDLLIIGRELLIPELQGDSYELSKTDSARIAQGYYLAYRAYKKYDEEKAEGYLKVAKKFSTTLE